MTKALVLHAKRKLVSLKDYSDLRRKIEEVLTMGRKRAQEAVERETVRTYWEIGRLIEAHVLQHRGRADYGEEVLKRLSRDLGLHQRILYYALKFVRAYPILKPASKLSWSHYQALLSVRDGSWRRLLANRVETLGWSREALRQKIRSRKTSRPPKPGRNRLIPKQGSLSTYQIVKSVTLAGKETLLIDLGFSSFVEIPADFRGKFQAGDLLEADGKRLQKTPQASVKDLFTYKAHVERVVDGDTLWTKIDLGFGVSTRQKLRLRGIDAPEMKTRSGKPAQRFLEAELKRVPWVVLTTSRSDKYDRYLTDLYAGEVYINQLLLDQGFARLAES